MRRLFITFPIISLRMASLLVLKIFGKQIVVGQSMKSMILCLTGLILGLYPLTKRDILYRQVNCSRIQNNYFRSESSTLGTCYGLAHLPGTIQSNFIMLCRNQRSKLIAVPKCHIIQKRFKLPWRPLFVNPHGEAVPPFCRSTQFCYESVQ